MANPVLDHQTFILNRAKKMEDRAIQIGRLCVAWSALEFDITLLLARLANFSDSSSKNVVLGTMDLRHKIAAVRALGFTRQPDDQWYYLLDSSLKEIDDTIRPDRNRMIHDFWSEVPGTSGAPEIHRVQIRPKVVNVRSRTKELSLVDIKAITAEDIESLCEATYRVNATILDLDARYALSTSA